jgi:hypothetical protein
MLTPLGSGFGISERPEASAQCYTVSSHRFVDKCPFTDTLPVTEIRTRPGSLPLDRTTRLLQLLRCVAPYTSACSTRTADNLAGMPLILGISARQHLHGGSNRDLQGEGAGEAGRNELGRLAHPPWSSKPRLLGIWTVGRRRRPFNNNAASWLSL